MMQTYIDSIKQGITQLREAGVPYQEMVDSYNNAVSVDQQNKVGVKAITVSTVSRFFSGASSPRLQNLDAMALMLKHYNIMVTKEAMTETSPKKVAKKDPPRPSAKNKAAPEAHDRSLTFTITKDRTHLYVNLSLPLSAAERLQAVVIAEMRRLKDLGHQGDIRPNPLVTKLIDMDTVEMTLDMDLPMKVAIDCINTISPYLEREETLAVAAQSEG